MADKTDKDIKRLKTIVGNVKEESKIKLDQLIMEFEKQRELQEITFPNQLTNIERAYVHFQATRKGLKSFSTGSGSERRLTLRRAVENTSMEAKTVKLTSESVEGVSNLLRALPAPSFPRSRAIENGQSRAVNEKGPSSASRLSCGPFPKVPRERKTHAYLDYRRQLPIWEHKDRIVELVQNHRVVFIQGSTGCGKTTQVGQFILEHACLTSQKVRIICTVPRRIAAVSVSERVAVERGERLGQTVGYQIRLESVVSPTETLLTYCTSGILLRSLTGSDYRVLNSTTHIIIDEIHERDRQTDFLLTCLRDILQMFPNLHLIVMGANLDNELFSSYFGGELDCPIVQVEGRLHPVKVYFLEEVLDLLQYENYDMRSTKRQDKEADGYNDFVQRLAGKFDSSVCITDPNTEDSGDQTLEQGPMPEVDDIIEAVWKNGDETKMMEFLDLVESKQVSVNYKHSTAGVTMLMAAAVRGAEDCAKILLDYGADLNIKSKGEDYEFSAIDWAADHRQHGSLKLLMEHQYEAKLAKAMDGQHMNAQTSQRLANYLRSIDEERVDLLLILRLLHSIHRNADPSHAILVFLPGYDEIVTLKHLITTDTQLGFGYGSFRIFMLHSNIQTGDQRAAFEKPPKGTRKIVLSTNIAESSLTIEDIVYVLDSGKVKEKSFDSLTSVTQLKSVWISKASVNQRRGRAGRCRPGICYHLFSSARYESMPEYPIPEIVRTSLQELCLQARSFIKPDVSIARFFSRIPEPPAPIAVKKSVELLTVMGALDEKEHLTTLGVHLLDFPVEPFLGKALIYAIVFRCLDPILTLVAVISYRDPFQLPSDPQDKKRAHECKVKFSQGSYSDHMAYLKAFQDWEKATSAFHDSTQRRFCRDNYLSSVTFEMIYAIRTQLLGQLRASGFVKTKGRGDLRELNAHSNNWALVKGVLVATLYPNICGIDRTKKVLYNSFNSKVAFHPSTTVTTRKNAVQDVPTDWIIFDEMTQQGSVNLVKGCTCVSTAAIALFAGSFTSTNGTESFSPNGQHSNVQISHARAIKINQWITLQGTKITVDILNFLRQKIKDLVLKCLESPSAPVLLEEQHTIQTVATLLVSEDNAIGFKNVQGIDQWPRLVSGNLMSAPKTGYGSPGSPHAATKASVDRYIVVEIENLWEHMSLLKNCVWKVPQWMKDRFIIKKNSGKSQGTLRQDLVLFFWYPTRQQFTGAVKLAAGCKLNPISEIPFELLGSKVISIQNAQHDIGFKANIDLPMNGLELDSNLGSALLQMFQ